VKRIHLLRFDGEPEELAPLLAAAGREGLRIGWLELAPDAVPAPVPDGLDAATSAGAFRAASAGAGRTVAVKRRSGPPVVRDLLREHFAGCALVVVRAAAGAAGLDDVARLEAAEAGYRLQPPEAAALDLTADALAARLRRPRPF
jgi:hypothetical protein